MQLINLNPTTHKIIASWEGGKDENCPKPATFLTNDFAYFSLDLTSHYSFYYSLGYPF